MKSDIYSTLVLQLIYRDNMTNIPENGKELDLKLLLPLLIIQMSLILFIDYYIIYTYFIVYMYVYVIYIFYIDMIYYKYREIFIDDLSSSGRLFIGN